MPSHIAQQALRPAPRHDLARVLLGGEVRGEGPAGVEGAEDGEDGVGVHGLGEGEDALGVHGGVDCGGEVQERAVLHVDEVFWDFCGSVGALLFFLSLSFSVVHMIWGRGDPTRCDAAEVVRVSLEQRREDGRGGRVALVCEVEAGAEVRIR